MKPADLKNNLVVKSNELITASYAMTVNEQRLLLACIGQIDSRTTLDNGAVFRLSVEQARDLFYTKGDQRHAYRDMQDACERLFERKVRIALPEKQELLTRFVQSIVFDPENGTADLRFAYEILPYLSQLEANFTKYRLSNIVQLTSSHAVRIYELIVSWATQGQYYKEIEIDAFRELLGLGEKYKQNSELKARVTIPAMQQINESTDLSWILASANPSAHSSGYSFASTKRLPPKRRIWKPSNSVKRGRCTIRQRSRTVKFGSGSRTRQQKLRRFPMGGQKWQKARNT